MNMEDRWKGTEFEIVLKKVRLTESWPKESDEIKTEILNWIEENEEITLMEEGEDILDGLETMLTEKGSGVTEDILMDATEIINDIIVAQGLVSQRVAPLFQKDGKTTTERIKRIGRAEGMMRMREEMRKIQNMRLKVNTRNYTQMSLKT